MFSRPVLPSRSRPETPQGSSVRVPSSTSAQGYMPQMHPPHNPSPPSNAMNDQVVQLLEALNHRIISLEQQLWASQNRRAAQKNVRNSPVRAFIDPDFGQLLSTQRIFDGCQRAGGSLSLVLSGQRPQLAPEREVLLIVRSDEDAEQVRNDVGRFKEIFGEKSYFYPESFYITPSAFSKDDLTRMSVSGGAKYDYCEMFKDPRRQLDAWRQETNLDIKGAHWKHGYLWLRFESVAEARKAVARDFFSSLCGFQTQFVSRDPRSIPMQCFNCQEIGHMSSRCPHKVPRCGYCASGHKTQECHIETATKKCAICHGPHEGYRLSQCRHPRVIDALEKCKLWRGAAPWDKSAASRVQGGVFEGEYTGTAYADSLVDGAFPGNDADLDDEAGFFDDIVIDEPVHHYTASPSHPMASTNQSFDNPVESMEFRTTSLDPGLAPHTSGNTMAPLNGTPILRDTSPSPSITNLAPGSTPCASGTTTAPFNLAPGAPVLRSLSPSPSDTSSSSRASLLECLENLPRSSGSHRASRETLLQTVAQIAYEADRAQLQSRSNSCSRCCSRTGLSAASEPNFGSTTDSTAESHPDPAAGSAKSDLGSDSRLDTSSTVSSISSISSLSDPAPDSATQFDSRNTVETPLSSTSTPPPSLALVLPAKRQAQKYGHRLARHDPKRRKGEEGESFLVPAEAREDATSFDENSDKAQSCALTEYSSAEDANNSSENNTRDEPMATQAEDRDSSVSAEATSRTFPAKVQHPETSRSAIEDTTQLGNCLGSLIPGDAAPGSSPAEAPDNTGPAQPEKRVTRSSVARAEATAMTPETPRHTRTSDEEISSNTSPEPTTGSPRGGNSWTTPETDPSSSTCSPTTASSPCPTADGDEESLPKTTSAAPPAPQQERRLLRSQRNQPNPDLGQEKGRTRKQDTEDTTHSQTQSDDHELEPLDGSDLGDAEEDCIIVSAKVTIRQKKLHDFFSPVSGPRVE